MLVDDADTQARWYYRLKSEYPPRPRRGPAVREPGEADRALRWRS